VDSSFVGYSYLESGISGFRIAILISQNLQKVMGFVIGDEIP
jgi:hypothetical protein